MRSRRRITAKLRANRVSPAGERQSYQGEFVARITVQKRQKEMKRLERQRMKAERRAQRKLAKTAEPERPEQNEGASGEAEPQDTTQQY
jgi:hypothetical protein